MSSHTWAQVGTRDAEGFRTHTTPGDICKGCSDTTGFLVPVSQCPLALTAWKVDHDALITWEGEGGS